MSAVPAQKLDLASPQAFGERMQYRLRDLLANPYTFLPDYTNLYNVLINHANALTPHQALAMSMLLGGDSAKGYPDMPNTAALVFPDVDAFQADCQVGWYYFAGRVSSDKGKDYSVLCMLFNNALLPKTYAQHFGISDLQNQVVDVQLAIGEAGGKWYQSDPELHCGLQEEIRTSERLCLEVGSASAESIGSKGLFPIRVKAKGVDRSGDKPVAIEIDLVISSGRNYLLQGWDGAVPLVGGIGTRYYSIPGLVVDAEASHISVGGERISLSGGSFWMDHQWGTGLTPSGKPHYESMRAAGNLAPAPVPGWDFFCLNFDGNRSITLNGIHNTSNLPFVHQTGPTPPGKMTSQVVGKYMDSFGVPFNVSGMLIVDEWRKSDHSPNPAKYGDTHTWFPHRWSFELMEPVLPKVLRCFHLVPICPQTQALFFANGSQYVEAAVDIIEGRGDGEGVKIGMGTAESVGYANNTETTLNLAGIAPTPDVLALIKEAYTVTDAMKILSLGYLALDPAHKAKLDALMACGSFPPAARPMSCS